MAKRYNTRNRRLSCAANKDETSGLNGNNNILFDAVVKLERLEDNPAFAPIRGNRSSSNNSNENLELRLKEEKEFHNEYKFENKIDASSKEVDLSDSTDNKKYVNGFISARSLAEKISDDSKSKNNPQNELQVNEYQLPNLSYPKKRKLWADSTKCFEYASSDISAKTLHSPLDVNLHRRSSQTDGSKGLHPRTRLRRKSSNTHKDVNNVDGAVSSRNIPESTTSRKFSASGFQTASSVYHYDNQCLNVTKSETSYTLGVGNDDTSFNTSTYRPSRRASKKQIPQNQKSIKSFFSSSSLTSTTSKMSDNKSAALEDCQSECKEMVKSPSLPTTPSKMYSPIKQISPSIYIQGSPSESCTSMVEHPKSQTHVSKKLFEESRKASLGSRSKKRKKNTPTILQKRNHILSANVSVVSPTIRNFLDSDDDDFEDMSYSPAVNKTFGLVDSNVDSDVEIIEERNYFQLPYEVIENIFCQLPILDLCLNCNRVCKQWNDIISNEKFLPWKKQFFKQLKCVQGSFNVTDILRRHEMLNPNKFLLAFIKYMKDFKPITYIGDNMIECLMTHPKYTWAVDMVKEKAKECVNEGVTNPWSLIACLVVISHSVRDVELILNCLLNTNAQCPVIDVIECFYCMATLLKGMCLRKRANVWNSLHYRVFYAIYLFENTSVADHGMLQQAVKGSKGQQSLIKYGCENTSVKLTHEQLRIVKFNPKEKEVVKIVAFAGTGKTTTLVRYTQLRPNLKFLLVVYNKSVCEYAKTKFPHNVTVKTGHGLAFGVTGRRYKAANKLNPWSLKVYTVATNLPSRKGENLYVRAKFVLETLNNFLSSDDDTVNVDHVPNFYKTDAGETKVIEESSKGLYVDDALYLWRRMKSFDDKVFGMTHDGYLKLYQLQKPKIYGYDVILIDEAQDLTPCLIDIVLQQSQTKILVGDPHQQIYSFRGAVNAMQQITATKTFYLTQSFRFGPEIAHLAACCLELLKNVTQKTIVGHGKPGKITGETVGQLAIIARCNFTVFAEAVRKVSYNDSSELRIAFVGGTDGFGFPIIQDIYTLMMSEGDRTNEKRIIENKFIARFPNIGELEKYATKALDQELLGKIKIVKTYNHSLPGHINKILSKTVHNQAVADIVFSTAHKSKGLEFSTVKVTDDYNYLGPGSAIMLNGGPIPHDESNLLYVALTRAKHALLLSPDLVKVLKESGMKFEKPVLSEMLKEKKVPFNCYLTGADFQPRTFTLQKDSVKLGCGTILTGGLISPQVLLEESHPFCELLGENKQSNVPDKENF